MTASAPPDPTPRGLRAMFRVHTASGLWPTALRTAIGVAGPAVIGLGLGDLPSGLLASLGGFLGLYGGGRPYVNRLRLLLGLSVGLSVAVGIGVWAGFDPWLNLTVAVLIAVVATWITNAFDLQPGAYQFALSCAAGSAIHATGSDPVRTALLVLAGGLLATALPMFGALADTRGPERRAVSAAADAVAEFIDTRGTDAADEARHQASLRMQAAWVALVNQQPQRRHPGRSLLRLREITRQLQLILAEAMRGPRLDGNAGERARRLGRQARRRSGAGQEFVLYGQPLGRPSVWSTLRVNLDPQSRSALILLRVAGAAALAGAVGTGFGLTNAYWAVATAVLVLGSGFDGRRTVQRSLERTLGTLAGAGVTGVILLADPPAWVLVGAVAIGVYVSQLLVPRNYFSAAVFITCSALLMTAASGMAPDLVELLQARAVDTLVGCLAALAVFALLSRRRPDAWLPDTLADALLAAASAVDQLAPGKVATPTGLAARRNLQRQLVRLSEAYTNAINGYAAQRIEAERTWPTLVAVERLGYRVLAEGWRLQVAPGPAAVEVEPPASAGLRQLAEALRDGRPVTGRGEVPTFLSRDVGDLRRLLVSRRPSASAVSAS